MRLGTEKGKVDAEGGALLRDAATGEIARVLRDDVGGDGEAEAGTAFLGGEEGIEDALLIFGAYACALVNDFDGERGGGSGAADAHHVCAVRGLDCIEDEVEEDLLELFGITVELGEICPEIGYELHVVEYSSVTSEGDGGVDDGGGVEFLEAGKTRASEVEEVSEELVEALRFLAEDVEAFVAVFGRGLAAH